jgi:hypothetical protein
MKKGTFAGKILATVALSAITICANAQFFLPASTQEDVFPALQADVPWKSSYTSAYCYGNVVVNSNPYDLYVHTWDGGDNLLGGAGFAVRQYSPNTVIEMGGTAPVAYDSTPSTFPIDDVASLEAAILQDGTDVFIALTYYRISTGRFYYDLYQWDPSATNYLTQVGTPRDLFEDVVPLGTPLPFSWIRMDAINLTEYAIAYEHNGRIIMHASDDPSNPNYPIAMDHSFMPAPSIMPDIALSKINYGSSYVTKVFVTCLDRVLRQQLFVLEMNFTDIVQTSPPTPLLLITPTVLVNRYADLWGMPRIDAPDNSPLSDMSWSYVATDFDLTNQTEIIHAGVNVAGTLMDYRLNDGSLGSLLDISDATTGVNRNPVVAYDENFGYINYCWYYNNSSTPPSPYSSHAYLGLKMRTNGSLWSSSNDYWLANYAPDSTSGYPSISLSTQNDASPYLFTAFTQNDPVNGYYYMGLKTVDWNNVGYKPGATEVVSVSKDVSFSLHPNPARETFFVKINDSKGLTYTLITLQT